MSGYSASAHNDYLDPDSRINWNKGQTVLREGKLPRYAESTTVTVDKSKTEIERILRRYGADQFMYGWDANQAVIGFRLREMKVKMTLPLPDISDFKLTPEKRQIRTAATQEAAFEQATRQRWRALALVIKAKLEAVEAGITTMEDEFLSYIMLPNNQTVGQWMLPQVAESIRTRQMPNDLPMLGAGRPQ